MAQHNYYIGGKSKKVRFVPQVEEEIPVILSCQTCAKEYETSITSRTRFGSFECEDCGSINRISYTHSGNSIKYSYQSVEAIIGEDEQP